MVGLGLDPSWSVVVKIRKRYFILGPNLLPNYQLTYIIKLIPVFILLIDIPKKRLKLRTSRYRHIQSFRSTKRLHIEQIIVILVYQITQKLICKSVKI